jgi:hypothetical protein
MWRNVTDVVAPAAAHNNAALPLWMIVFGVTLLAIGYGRAPILSSDTVTRPDVRTAP